MVACLSRGDGCQSWEHGVTGEQDDENQVGGMQRVPVSQFIPILACISTQKHFQIEPN